MDSGCGHGWMRDVNSRCGHRVWTWGVYRGCGLGLWTCDVDSGFNFWTQLILTVTPGRCVPWELTACTAMWRLASATSIPV